MKPKKIKARKMWAIAPAEEYPEKLTSTKKRKEDVRLYVLPADAASVERMVEQMAKAMSSNAIPWDHIGYGAQQARLAAMRAALAAVGIK